MLFSEAESRSAPVPRQRCVSADVVATMRATLAGETDAVLMRQFGISYNTWVKIRSGRPIRPSVAQRLEARVRTP